MLFRREAEIIFSDGLEIKTVDGVKLEVDYKSNDGNGLPSCEVSILNLNRNDMNIISTKQKCFLNIGFDGNLGELTAGDVKNIKIDGTQVTFEISSDHKAFSTSFNKWYNKGSRDVQIVNDIAKNLNIQLTGVENFNGFVKTNGCSVVGNGINSIYKLAHKRKLKVTTKGKNLIIYDQNKDKPTGSVLLQYDSGLLDINKIDDKKYDFAITSLPIAEIGQNDLIRVEHEKLNAKCKVIDFEISLGSNWVAKYLVKVVK